MRSAFAACALVVALGLSGCTSSRALTPWLRTYAYRPFELIAESGSHARGDAWVERRIGTRWVTSRDLGVSGFAFAHGERVVLGNQLLTRDGRTVPLACDGRGIGNGLRVNPRDELLCVEVRTWLDREVPAEQRETARIVRYDIDGGVRGEQVVPLPIPRPADAPPMALSIDTGVVGFVGDSLVFSVLVSREHESWASDVVKEATAHALDASGRWRVLGTMRFRVGDIWMIHSAARWSEALGIRIEPGTVADVP